MSNSFLTKKFFVLITKKEIKKYITILHTITKLILNDKINY